MRNLLGNWTRRAWLATWLQDRRRARLAATGLPGAPQNLNGTDTGSLIQLDWSPGTGTVTGLRVYRRVAAGADVLYAVLGASAVTYQDSGVSFGQSYTYTVAAYNTVGESARSNSYLTVFGA